LLGLPVTVVPRAGHQLPKDYVSSLLDSFFTETVFELLSVLSFKKLDNDQQAARQRTEVL